MPNDLHLSHQYLFHLVQAELWQESVNKQTVYYPPTYEQDGFTHGTANPQKLLQVANHFYQDVPGEWLCLRMTIESLAKSGVETVFEGTAAVGDKPDEFDNSNGELFPHLQGGIHPTAVLAAHAVERTPSGEFLSVEAVTNADGAAGANSGPGYAKYQGYTVTFEAIDEEVVVRLCDTEVCCTRGAIRVLESRHESALYLPQTDFAAENLTGSNTSTYCPFKGTASYRGLVAGGQSVEDALWYYPQPYDEVDFLKTYFGIYLDRVGAVTVGGTPW